ncbi:DNA-directed RNA polymerase II subunit rpb1 [Chytriomyces hyalinus]|nr:DNA-directed RNA polymerase II subunit rpb1 [Chytriomyces hyalinus]
MLLKAVNSVPGIERALVSHRTTGVYGNTNVTKEYIIETEGINLRGVMKVKDVDHLVESLLNEIRGVIEDVGSAINYRHLALLVEVMTHCGGIMSITSHSINRIDVGPPMKYTFEQTVDILFKFICQNSGNSPFKFNRPCFFNCQKVTN